MQFEIYQTQIICNDFSEARWEDTEVLQVQGLEKKYTIYVTACSNA
jgi:hypothetical protein